MDILQQIIQGQGQGQNFKLITHTKLDVLQQTIQGKGQEIQIYQEIYQEI